MSGAPLLVVRFRKFAPFAEQECQRSRQAFCPFDMMTALEHWVEQGLAPERILATKYLDDDPKKASLPTHPLCPYPEVARYSGHGSPDDARNFVCEVESSASE